jgi:hypothetical protein
VARELRRRLEKSHLLAAGGRPSVQRFWTTGDVQPVVTVMSQLLRESVAVACLPK